MKSRRNSQLELGGAPRGEEPGRESLKLGESSEKSLVKEQHHAAEKPEPKQGPEGIVRGRGGDPIEKSHQEAEQPESSERDTDHGSREVKEHKCGKSYDP